MVTESPKLSIEKMKVPKEVRERFKNISVPHITHMDTVESELVISSELGYEPTIGKAGNLHHRRFGQIILK